MPRRQSLQKTLTPLPHERLWSRLAVRDLDGSIEFLRAASQYRRNTLGHAAAGLGALISYSRPFTERSDAALKQTPQRRLCFLGVASDLGADLHLHAVILQARDEVMALSDFVTARPGRRSPAAKTNTRRFKYPDPRYARITGRLNFGDFRRLTGAMRLACDFFQAEIESRSL